MNGTVFNIQRFSVHDGPSIRTTVFMKGCNLHCFWCHNPESLSKNVQLQFFAEKCIGCGSCRVCPQGAHIFGDEGHIFDRGRCIACGKCADACFSGALELTGKTYTPEEVFNEVKKDAPFYRKGGGVTFSGGEPLLQYEFVAECAELCRNAGFSVAVDTAGNVPYSSFERVIPFTDLFLFDVKHFDSDIHRANTGADNARIRENLVRLLRDGAGVWIRIPLIPENNASDEDIRGIAEYIAGIYAESGGRAEKIELMPFHGMASGKYRSLGMNYRAADFAVPPKEDVERYYSILNDITG